MKNNNEIIFVNESENSESNEEFVEIEVDMNSIDYKYRFEKCVEQNMILNEELIRNMDKIDEQNKYIEKIENKYSECEEQLENKQKELNKSKELVLFFVLIFIK